MSNAARRLTSCCSEAKSHDRFIPQPKMRFHCVIKSIRRITHKLMDISREVGELCTISPIHPRFYQTTGIRVGTFRSEIPRMSATAHRLTSCCSEAKSHERFIPQPKMRFHCVIKSIRRITHKLMDISREVGELCTISPIHPRFYQTTGIRVGTFRSEIPRMSATAHRLTSCCSEAKSHERFIPQPKMRFHCVIKSIRHITHKLMDIAGTSVNYAQ